MLAGLTMLCAHAVCSRPRCSWSLGVIDPRRTGARHPAGWRGSGRRSQAAAGRAPSRWRGREHGRAAACSWASSPRRADFSRPSSQRPDTRSAAPRHLSRARSSIVLGSVFTTAYSSALPVGRVRAAAAAGAQRTSQRGCTDHSARCSPAAPGDSGRRPGCCSACWPNPARRCARQLRRHGARRAGTTTSPCGTRPGLPCCCRVLVLAVGTAVFFFQSRLRRFRICR